MSHEKASQNNPVARNQPIVWSDDNPSMVWTLPGSQNVPATRDLKVSMVENCPPSSYPEPPPKYHSRDDSAHCSWPSYPQRRSSERLPIKFLVMAVYLILAYRLGAASFEADLSSVNWGWTQAPFRSHSRDFVSLNPYGFLEEEDAWSRSRLGRLGSYSPLLTPSEMELFLDVGWEEVPEPMMESKAKEAEEELEESKEETIFTNLDQPNLPLPLHFPSSLFRFSRENFEQGMKRLAFDSQESFLRFYDLN